MKNHKSVKLAVGSLLAALVLSMVMPQPRAWASALGTWLFPAFICAVPETHTGTETHSGATTFSGAVSLTGPTKLTTSVLAVNTTTQLALIVSPSTGTESWVQEASQTTGVLYANSNLNKCAVFGDGLWHYSIVSTNTATAVAGAACVK